MAHECSKFPRRRELGMVWRCGYCGGCWRWVERVDDEWGDVYRVWEREDARHLACER